MLRPIAYSLKLKPECMTCIGLQLSSPEEGYRPKHVVRSDLIFMTLSQ